MLLWLVVGLGFLACVVAWHFWQGISTYEAAMLFAAAAAVFVMQSHYIYDKNTTDHYIISGYVSSVLHRPSYTYRSGKHTYTEPEKWLVEQTPYAPSRLKQVSRPYIGQSNKQITETCYGDCFLRYPEGEPGYAPWLIGTDGNGKQSFAIWTSEEKANRVQQGESSAVTQTYYNPVMSSDDVVYQGSQDKTPYFEITDYNVAGRLIMPYASEDQSRQFDQINAVLSTKYNISVGLIVTDDEMYFQKLQRAWHMGKPNDFVIVINSSDGRTIRNVNILGWDNYNLRENASEAIAGIGTIDIDQITATLKRVFDNGPDFKPKDFESYRFVHVKIPKSDYFLILSYEVIYFAYMMLLLIWSPGSKTEKVSMYDVSETWSKHGKPSSQRYYLHPLSLTGVVFFYTTLPIGFFFIWEQIVSP